MSELKVVPIPALEGTFMANRAKYGLPVSELCVHHKASTCTNRECRDYWASKYKSGHGATSSNYGIKDDEIAVFVSDGDIAYCNSNWDSNCRSLSVEVSNSAGAPNWPVSDKSFESLVQWAAAKSKQYSLHPLVPGKNLTWHQMYAATACPGPYLLGKMQELADRANAINEAASPPPDTGPSGTGLYHVQVGSFTSAANAQNFALKVKKAGFAAIIKQSGKTHRVQVGAFSSEKNAKDYIAKVKKAGFDAVLMKG